MERNLLKIHIYKRAFPFPKFFGDELKAMLFATGFECRLIFCSNGIKGVPSTQACFFNLVHGHF